MNELPFPNSDNCENFSNYRLFGYKVDNPRLIRKYENGFYEKVKGIYCLVSLEDFRRYREKEKTEFQVNIKLLDLIENKYIVVDEITVSTNEIEPLMWEIIN